MQLAQCNTSLSFLSTPSTQGCVYLAKNNSLSGVELSEKMITRRMPSRDYINLV